MGKRDHACVIARFTDAVTGEALGIWRRPIDGNKPKSLGAMRGCVIRLWPDEDVTGGLVIGEGVETTLCVATRFKRRGTLLQPAWAAASAGNLENFPEFESSLPSHAVRSPPSPCTGRAASHGPAPWLPGRR
jgi:hypothetical protein